MPMTGVVPLDAAPHEMAALREVLGRLASDTPDLFAALFDPLASRRQVEPPPEITYLLRLFGLVSGEKRLVGRARIRRHADRFYLLDDGRPTDYRQDVWPETDALLAELATAPPGRLVDMGTGSGIVAIEAAARGHTVVATDVHGSALRLARFNARLAGLAERVDLLKGHLFEPVRDRVFDLVLTAPHYTRVADQLRLETLRSVPSVLAAGGRSAVATFLEWEGDGPLAAAETLLAAQAASGLDITVTPIASPLKRAWFTAAAPNEDDGALPGLVSRHRFLVTYRHAPATGRLLIERPGSESKVFQRYVSLGRLGPTARPGRGALAVVRDEIDVEALERLLLAVREGVVTLAEAVPAGLLDACRFGGVMCVSDRVVDGAAGAILDRTGGVRPCAHGGTVGTLSDTMAELVARYRLEARRAAERRGCATCPAEARCSRCLFPNAIEEARYCDLIRAFVDELPGLHRLLAILAELGDRLAPVRVKLRRAPALVAASGRPPADRSSPPSTGGSRADDLRSLALRWTRSRAALVVDGLGRCTIFVSDGRRGQNRPVTAVVAAIAELVGDGMTVAELREYAALEGIPAGGVEAALSALATLLPDLD